jgi:dynein heavy chain
MIFISAMGPPGGGRSVITPRLQRHFNILTYTDLPYDIIGNIFKTIINAFFAVFTQDVRDSVDKIISITLKVYD